MEAAAEGAVGLSEAREGSPLSGAAASDDADTVVGVSYGMEAAGMGKLSLISDSPCAFNVHSVSPESIFAAAVTRKSRLISATSDWLS